MNVLGSTSVSYPRLLTAAGFGVGLVVFSFLLLLTTHALGYNVTAIAWLIRYVGIIIIFFAGFWYLFHILIDWPLNRR